MKRKISEQEFLSKLQDTYNKMDMLLEVNKETWETKFSKDVQKEVIVKKLKECISVEEDINKAWAIIDYVRYVAKISLDDLILRDVSFENWAESANVCEIY